MYRGKQFDVTLLSLFITSKTLKGALEVIIRSQIATVFNRILFPNLIIFGNFWQLLATFGNFVNLGESCQKLLRTPPLVSADGVVRMPTTDRGLIAADTTHNKK